MSGLDAGAYASRNMGGAARSRYIANAGIWNRMEGPRPEWPA